MDKPTKKPILVPMKDPILVPMKDPILVGMDRVVEFSDELPDVEAGKEETSDFLKEERTLVRIKFAVFLCNMLVEICIHMYCDVGWPFQGRERSLVWEDITNETFEL